MLAERSAGDVRCCLNTLQFLGRRRGAVRAADAAGACAGHKDVQQAAFSVWEQLLWTRVSGHPKPGCVLLILQRVDIHKGFMY